jgi:hypothetical protein
MAQTRRRRRRKHRGTQSGSIDRRPTGPRPRSRAEARARARSQLRGGGRRKSRRTGDRRDVPPTWRSAVNRALIGAGIFLLLLLVPFHQKPTAAIPLAVVMLALYIPLGYAIERFFYTRRQAKKAQAGSGGQS